MLDEQTQVMTDRLTEDLLSQAKAKTITYYLENLHIVHGFCLCLIYVAYIYVSY